MRRQDQKKSGRREEVTSCLMQSIIKVEVLSKDRGKEETRQDLPWWNVSQVEIDRGHHETKGFRYILKKEANGPKGRAIVSRSRTRNVHCAV